MSTVYVVATPIGNLSDMTFRAIEVLSSVSLIAAEDTRRTIKLLNHFEIKTPLISYHKFNERDRGREIIERMLREDTDIAIVSDAGTPCISDPGSILVDLAYEAGVTVLAIPGSSAVVSALSSSGFAIDHFAFLGFVPRKGKERESFFHVIETSEIDVFVLFESPNRIIQTMEALAEYLPDCRVLVLNDITKRFEKKYRGDVVDVVNRLRSDENVNLGEYTIVVKKTVPYEEPVQEDLSPEARLIDWMVKENGTIKEAIESISGQTKISKKELYKASLRLKDLFEQRD